MEALILQKYDEWLAEHFEELVDQYSGKVVAIQEGKIIFIAEFARRVSNLYLWSFASPVRKICSPFFLIDSCRKGIILEVFHYKTFHGRLPPMITIGVRIGGMVSGWSLCRFRSCLYFTSCPDCWRCRIRSSCWGLYLSTSWGWKLHSCLSAWSANPGRKRTVHCEGRFFRKTWRRFQLAGKIRYFWSLQDLLSREPTHSNLWILGQ